MGKEGYAFLEMTAVLGCVAACAAAAASGAWPCVSCCNGIFRADWRTRRSSSRRHKIMNKDFTAEHVWHNSKVRMYICVCKGVDMRESLCRMFDGRLSFAFGI